MNFNKWYGIAVLMCLLFWMAMFSLFKGCCEQAFAREAGPGFYVEAGQSLMPVETHILTIGGDLGYGINNEDYIFYTDLNVHYVFKPWFFELAPFANIKTWSVTNTVIDNKPFCVVYTAGCEIVYGGVSISVDHYCAHSVRSSDEMWKVKDYRMGQNMTEIKLRYSFN